MRVYESLCFNLKNIRFKDDLDEMSALLNKLGVAFSGVAFNFSPDFGRERIDGIVSRFPALKTCVRQVGNEGYALSSISENADGSVNMYLDSPSLIDFAALLKKIPRPINFAFMGVLMDNVDWYGDGRTEPSFTGSAKEVTGSTSFSYYFSNSVRFFKEFDYGNKYNPIFLCLDRTGENGELRERPEKFCAAVKALGKPYYKKVRIVIDKEEELICKEKIKKIREKALRTCDSPELLSLEKDVSRRELSPLEKIMPVSGFSPKKILSTSAKKHGFKYVSCRGGNYNFRKTSEHGHVFIAEIMNLPVSPAFEGWLTAKGYNFEVSIALLPRLYLNNAEDFTAFSEASFDFFEKAIDSEKEELAEAFGESPGWFAEFTREAY